MTIYKRMGSIYTLHRYGEPRSPSLPHTASSKPINAGLKREAIIERTMDVLRQWKSSRFQNEAMVRHGLRVAFIFQGYRWSLSDAEAQSLTAEALRRLGYERPTWLDGQREHALPAENCRRCGAPVPAELLRDRRVNFCSDVCAKVNGTERMMERKRRDDEVYEAARDVIERSRHKARACKTCGTMFRPRHLTGHMTGEYCSPNCKQIGSRTLLEKNCLHCGTGFRGTYQSQMYCSRACYNAAGSRVLHDKICEACGTRFQATRKHARFCSDACQTISSRMSDPKRTPKRATPLLIDYLIIQAGGIVSDGAQPVP